MNLTPDKKTKSLGTPLVLGEMASFLVTQLYHPLHADVAH